MTRTFFIANDASFCVGNRFSPSYRAAQAEAGIIPTDRQIDIYSTVQKAQLAGVRAARPGIICKDLDAVCRDIIENAGYGAYFVHTTGHGVGTEVHEDPRIGKEDETPLEAGMVITVEPGIYIEDFGGVRIEDTVIITEDGCEIITGGVEKKLLTL
jgi:Xaa-Pro aminopeptidase